MQKQVMFWFIAVANILCLRGTNIKKTQAEHRRAIA